MIEYFVSYWYVDEQRPGIFGFGNAVLGLLRPVVGESDVHVLTDTLRRTYPERGKIIVLSFQRLGDGS